MRKTGIVGIAILILTGLSLAYCESYTKKVNNEFLRAELEKRCLPDKEENFVSTQKDYNSDFEKFIKAANHKINGNEKIISELSKSLNMDNNTSALNTQDEIVVVGKKNYDLKMKLDYYVEEGKGNWKTFKDDLNNDLSDLDLAINEIKQNDE